MKGYKKCYTIIMVLGIVIILSACGNHISQSNNLMKDVESVEVEGKETDTEFVRGATQFSLNLLQEEADNLEKDSNLLIAPYSVLSALAMTANGAAGDTLKEMEEVLCNEIEIAELNEYLYTLQEELDESRDVTFHTANSIWIKENDNLQVKESFLQTERSYYNADAYKVPMNQKTVDDINDWVNEETNEMIPILLEEVSEDAVMYLINALAFEGNWLTPYEDYEIHENSIFTNASGEEELVTMLHSDEPTYIYDEKCTGFLKYYKDDRFAFMAILPDEGYSVEEYLSEMTAERYLALFDSRMQEEVIVQMPEFSYEYDTELKESLEAMGIKKAFEGTADFSNMADVRDSFFINQVVHKTYIEVDRTGTKAAAVSSIDMNVGCAPEEDEPLQVYLNRPFIYGIVDIRTGLPIFIGVVNTIQ